MTGEPSPSGTSYQDAGRQTDAVEYAHSFEDVAARLLGNAESVCRHLLPGGKRLGKEYVCADTRGGKGRSLSINLATGVWSDFATGDAGADLINLWATAKGVGQGEAKAEAEAWLGLSSLAGSSKAEHTTDNREVAGSTPAPPTSPPEVDDLWWRSAKPDCVWDYHDARGQVVAKVYRWTHPVTGAKEIRPWDMASGRWEHLEVRPLYGLPRILAKPDDPVILVEGEKCADAVMAATPYIATTISGGAQATGKTDWAPLRARTVVLWRDNDPAGLKWEEHVLAALRGAEVAFVQGVAIPEDKPSKWDAADAQADEALTLIRDALAATPVARGRPPMEFHCWSTDRYAGPPPAREWLVRGVWPAHVAAILAAMGDTGKGMLTLDMALKVAACEDMRGQPALSPEAFGGPIDKFGRVVILSAEDDHAELHRRLHSFDPDGALREKAMDRLYVAPLPNMGGTRPFFVRSGGSVEATDDFNRIYDRLLNTQDLALVIIDPLVSFVSADLNQEGAAASQVMSAFASLASDTGATVVAVHHMRKTAGGQDVIASPDQARAAIRGQSALVDGSRASYALWQAGDKEAKKMLRMLNQPIEGGAWRKRVIQGAVVKANGPSDMTVRTYIRDMRSGLLVDHTPSLTTARIEADDEQRAALVAEIAGAAQAGRPLVKTGAGGLFANRASMDPCLHGVSRQQFERLLEELTANKQVCTCRHQKKTGLLDVPDGPFATGLGTLREGA